MSLMHPVSCVSDSFSLYRIYFCLIDWNWYHSMNPICLMISLTMMGLDPGLLVRVLLRFTLMNLLVVLENLLVMSVLWVWEFLSQHKLSQLMTFFCWMCSYQK